ncbi:MAG: VCBS repeat-containing protein, partial [Verrucomicrobia bacterium]|nr:VCBS repeat-containing protein [Verrucomicrobiota bacterium]
MRRSAHQLALGLAVGFLMVGQAALGQAGQARGFSPGWAVPDNAYRVAVTVDPGPSRRTNCPVGVEINFDKIFKDADIPGRLDRHSIRVVQCDPAADHKRGNAEVPYQLTGDFPNNDAGRIWWRMRDEKATHYHIYFDSLANGPKTPPSRMGLIGIGDSFHYNNGQPGPAPVHPLHSQFWHLDWDGDGKRDLIGFAYRRYEHGAPLEKNMGNGIYFLKNIGTSRQPLFAPRYRLKADDGRYLQTDLLPQNMFPTDWNGDGHVDFIGVDGRKNLLLWENTGSRDRNHCYVLKHPRVLAPIGAASDFRSNVAGVIRKPTFYIRAINPVDWNGDGGRDMIVSWLNTNILGKVDPRKGVIPYGPPLMIFELLEDISTEKGGAPVYAPPRVITEERGLPLNAACFATGGVAYVDWDGDGDCDLLFHDDTNRPLDGGRLMFAENAGTRQQPLFLMPIPILQIADSPQVVDWNGDGLFDLIAGGEFFENTNPLTGGTARRPVRGTTPAGTRLPHAWSYPQLVSRGQACQTHPEMLGHWAASVDWNGDGTLDIVRGMTSHVQVFINKGTNLNPVFEPSANLAAGGKDICLPNWLDLQADPPSDRGPQGMGEAEHSWLNPTVGDFDRDGDLDLFVTSQRWQTLYFENAGTRTQPVLAKGREVRYQGNPQEFSWRSKISIGDLDADGITDMVVTSDQDNVFYAYHPAAK